MDIAGWVGYGLVVLLGLLSGGVGGCKFCLRVCRLRLQVGFRVITSGFWGWL